LEGFYKDRDRKDNLTQCVFEQIRG